MRAEEMTRENKISARCCPHSRFENPPPHAALSIFTQADLTEQLRQGWLAAEHSAVFLHSVSLFGINLNDYWIDLSALLYGVQLHATTGDRGVLFQHVAPDAVAPSGRAKVHLKTVAIAWVLILV